MSVNDGGRGPRNESKAKPAVQALPSVLPPRLLRTYVFEKTHLSNNQSALSYASSGPFSKGPSTPGSLPVSPRVTTTAVRARKAPATTRTLVRACLCREEWVEEGERRGADSDMVYVRGWVVVGGEKESPGGREVSISS